MTEYRNIHGRKGSRGVRPWILIPKVLAVCVFFGGSVAAAMLWFVGTWGKPEVDGALVEQIGLLFRRVILPGMAASVVLGVLLTLQHWRQFIRLRWWQVKVVSLVLGMPTWHLWMSSRLMVLRDAAAQAAEQEAARTQLGWGFAGLIVGAIWIILLGRLKPRLGQNWAKSYRPPAGADQERP